MTNKQTAYAEGYFYGYQDAAKEISTGIIHAMRQTHYEEQGIPMTNEDQGDWWIGYYHGRFHNRQGHPAKAARLDDIPENLEDEK